MLFKQGHALIIGTGAGLPNTVQDAKGLADILKDAGRCAYPPDQVYLLTETDTTRAAILTALDNLAQTANQNSTVVVYFSGHGYQVTSTTGQVYYLLPYGYDLNCLYQTAISGQEFTAKLRAIPAQKLLVLLDCCHAGGVRSSQSGAGSGAAKAPGLEFAKSPLPPEALTLLTEGKGRVLIASSKEDELSYVGKPYSAFTLALIEALCGVGMAKRDGYVRVADIALHAREVVPGRTKGKQHPILHFEQADNFVLAYYAGGGTQPKGVPFKEEPEIEPEPGAWRMGGDIVLGNKITTQTNIAGNVYGAVLPGQFNSPVVVGGGESVDMRGAQGVVYKPQGAVHQQFGDRIRITGGGNVIGNGSHSTAIEQQGAGITVHEFLKLLAELRRAMSSIELDPDMAESIQSDLRVVERQAHKSKPKPVLIVSKLNGILGLLATADGVWGITERVLPLAQRAVEWAGRLFK